MTVSHSKRFANVTEIHIGSPGPMGATSTRGWDPTDLLNFASQVRLFPQPSPARLELDKSSVAIAPVICGIVG